MDGNQRPKAYTGDKPYIFVSYSQADSVRVFPFILALQERYNVWFDEGIPVGADWMKEIEKHIDGCDVFLFMVSAQSLNSDFCRKEILLAQYREKKSINILMENGLEKTGKFILLCGLFQSFKLFEFPSDSSAVAALTEKSTWLKDVAKMLEPPENEPINKTESKLESKVVYSPAIQPVETKREAPPAVQQVWETPEETIKRFKGKLSFERLNDGTYKLVKGSSELQTVEIPNFVSVIGEEAFERAKLEYITIPESVKIIERNAFYYCFLRELRLPDSVTSIGDNAFAYTNLSSVTLGRGNACIEHCMFYGCSELRSIRIPEGVTVIGRSAFAVSGLTEITLPATLKTIGKKAFYATTLQRVKYRGTRRLWEKIDINFGNDQLSYADFTYKYVDP